MKRLIETVLLFLLGVAAAFAQNPSFTKEHLQENTSASVTTTDQAKMDPGKEADIRRLLDLTGVAAVAEQTMVSMETSLRPLMTQALPPGEYRAKLIELFFEKFHSGNNMHQLIELAIPIYDKYYSHEEIKGLIQFYETPLGQKAIHVMPHLVGELQDAGKTWGEKVGRECMAEVLAEHPDLAQALKDAKNPAFPK